MTREEAIEVYNGLINDKIKEAFEFFAPELKENDDERIRKVLVNMVKKETGFTGFPSRGQVLAYLEKQKEQTEELSTRLNGVMQEYVKEGKDEEEQEHRLRCYKLFWDALEDSEFFEQFKQKEQKPIARENDFVSKPKTSREILKHYLVWAENSEEDCPYTWKELANAIKDGITALEQKPSECIPDSVKFEEGFKTGRELGFREGVESAKTAEWIEEDSDMICEIIDHCIAIPYIGGTLHLSDERKKELKTFLKSLRPRKLDASKLENFDPVNVLNRIKMEWPMAWEKVVGKQEWSEEEAKKAAENYANEFPGMTHENDGSTIEDYDKPYNDFMAGVLWAKCRYQPKQEWSEEDREMLNSILLYFNAPFRDMTDNELKAFNWLRSLHERFNLPPKQEWSEEDEKMLDKVCCLISPGTILNASNADYCLELKQWIVSLQERILKLSCIQPKQEWSEFDSGVLEDAITATDLLGNNEKYKKDNPNLAKAFRIAKDWLKSLPERFNLPTRQEWSEEDERMRNQLIHDVEYHKKWGLISAKRNKATKALYNGIEGCYDEKIAWLKSLPFLLKKKNEDVAKLCSNEWSEEDEKIAKEIEEELWYPGNFPDYPSKEESELYDDCQRRLDWFKTKFKSLRPQPHTVSTKDTIKFGNHEYERCVKSKKRQWKPSEEQMKALEYFIRSWGESGTMSPQNTILCAANSLYSDLKKLL